MRYERPPYWFWPLDRWKLLLALLLGLLLLIFGPRACQAPAVQTVPSFTSPAANSTFAHDAAIEVTGQADANANVRIFDGDELLALSVADADGVWMATLPALAAGAHSLTARVYDDTGALLATSAPLALTILPPPPPAPTLNPLDAALLSGQPATVTGTAAPAATVRLFDGDALLGETVAGPDGRWTLAIPALAAGAHTLTARAFDAGGASLGDSIPLTFAVAVQTGERPAPTFDPIDPALTRGEAGVVTGTAAPAAVVRLFDGDALLGETVAGPDGRWTLAIPALAAGAHTLTARAFDAGGALLATSPALTFAVEGAAPAENIVFTPIITTPGSGQTLPKADPGQMSGTAAPGALVRLFAGDALLGETTADAQGNWRFDLAALTPGLLPSGPQTLVARTFDADGKLLAESAPLTITLAPAPPRFTNMQPGRLLSPLNPGSLNGEAEPGALVRIFDGDTLLGETTADTSGRWSFTLPALAAGEHALSARIVAADGAVLASSEPVAVTVPAMVEKPSISPPSSGLPAPQFEGLAPPGAVVRLYDGDILIGETVADEFGRWRFQPLAPLRPGARTLTPVIVAGGVEGERGEPVVVDIPEITPAAPVAGAFSLSALPPQSANSLPVLHGFAAPGAVIRVFDGQTLLGETTAAQDGSWRFQTPSPLTPGPHLLRLVDTSSGVSIEAPITITVEAQALPAPTILLPAKGQVTGGSPLRGTGPANSVIHIYAGNRLLGVTTADADGNWGLRLPTDLAQGDYLLRAVALAADGAILTSSAPALVTAMAAPGTLPVTGGG